MYEINCQMFERLSINFQAFFLTYIYSGEIQKCNQKEFW